MAENRQVNQEVGKNTNQNRQKPKAKWPTRLLVGGIIVGTGLIGFGISEIRHSISDMEKMEAENDRFERKMRIAGKNSELSGISDLVDVKTDRINGQLKELRKKAKAASKEWSESGGIDSSAYVRLESIEFAIKELEAEKADAWDSWEEDSNRIRGKIREINSLASKWDR